MRDILWCLVAVAYLAIVWVLFRLYGKPFPTARKESQVRW